MLANEDASPVLLLQSCTLWPTRLRPGAMTAVLHPPVPFVQAEEPFSLLPGGVTLLDVHGPTYLDYDVVIKMLKKSWWKKSRKIQKSAKSLPHHQEHSGPLQRKITFPEYNARESKQNRLGAVRGVFQDITLYSLSPPSPCNCST